MAVEIAARGMPLAFSARAIGVHVSTLRRWRQRGASGGDLGCRRGPRSQPPPEASRAKAEELLRATHGLVGANTLQHSVSMLSRRRAAGIKRDVCRQMERERRAAAERVVVAAPGLVRGFDAMELCPPDRPRRHLLVAADACVPYRTCWAVRGRYDAQAVAELLARDFEHNGPPLVLRLDRASQHSEPTITKLLSAHKVLPLHGPSHYARYYGQLERQNRDHRGWLAAGVGEEDPDWDAMMRALNSRWRRATLGWRTAAELWAVRVNDCETAAAGI